MIETIRAKINDNIGKNITIRYSLGRNKYEKLNVKIKEIYEDIFLVELNDKQTKSFTYIDIMTKTLKIKF